MRTPLLIAALGLASLMPTPTAEACGGYGDALPQVMLVSNHSARSEPRAQLRWRRFVLLGSTASAKLRFRPLAVHSYDATEIAALGRLATPMELTLVGESRTRTVTSARQVALRRSWRFDGAQVALEIDADTHERQFAILGAEESTAWLPTVTDDAGVVQVSKTAATARLESTTGGPVTVVSVGGHAMRRLPGYAVGAIEWRGDKFLLVDNRGAITPVRI